MPDIEIVDGTTTITHLRDLAEATFGDLVKVVVNIERGVMAIGGDLHSDEEASLLDGGSRQADLWGINLLPGLYPEPAWIEFDSMINIRPRLGNRTRGIDDPAIRDRIVATVGRLVG